MNDQEISKRALAIGGYTKWVRTGVFFFAPFWAAFTIATLFGLGTLITTAGDVLSDASNKDYATNIRWHALAFTAMLAAFGGLISAPFAIVRAYVAERQTRATEAQKDTAEQGLITDRFTKAVEQLGAEKTVKRIVEGKPQEWTEPNLEVRLGAIYALERITQDSERDRDQVIKMLCAYIRENVNRANNKLEKPFETWDYPLPVWPRDEKTTIEPQQTLQKRSRDRKNWVMRHSNPQRISADLYAAFSTVSNLTRISGPVNFRDKFFDFSQGNFQNIDLIDVRMKGADFSQADFDLSRLIQSQFPDTLFRSANFVGTQMQEATYPDCDFSWARFEDANCRWVNFSNSKFFHAKAEGAFFYDADLTKTDLFGSLFSMADLRGAKFDGARCRGADFYDALNMEQQQLNSMFGDESTAIPKSLRRPDHWPHRRLPTPFSPDTEYDNWLARGAPPGKPVVN